jgi:hypothetical protein
MMQIATIATEMMMKNTIFIIQNLISSFSYLGSIYS